MIDLILAFVGAVAGVTGTVVTYAQFRGSRREAADGSAEASSGQWTGYSVFAPHARVHGFVPDFINRKSELRALAATFRRSVSVVSIEGIAGAGKTALATAACQRLSGRRKLRWVFCGERGDLSLRDLATGLAYDPGLPSGKGLRAVLRRPDLRGVEVIDAVIQYLADHRIVLVLDDYHEVRDTELRQLVERLERSKIRSTLVLTTRRHPAELDEGALVERLTISGFSDVVAREFLRGHGVDAPDEVLDEVWRRTGRGIPEAMRIFAGLARRGTVADTLGDLPVYTDDYREWVRRLFDELTPPQQQLAKVIAFVYEPASLELLREIAPDDLDVPTALSELASRFVVTESGGDFDMHDLFRDFARSLISAEEQREHSSLVAKYHQSRARNLLLGERVEPSYGNLYLESFPDYVDNHERHERLIDDLMDRMAERSLRPVEGARVLVLGSGNGIHDPGLVKHRLNVVNVDIQPEIAGLGRAAARRLPGQVGYVVADMTRQLPFPTGSMDAAFNIGSSFGYEETDEENAAVFREAARVLKPGGPFVFEYANGDYWYAVQAQREVSIRPLPTGAIRTSYRVSDEEARTSLTSISLRRPDGLVGWFRHFMHYYPLAEIEDMMRRAGLEPVAVYDAGGGRVSGSAFDPARSPGMAIIAVKGG